MEPTKSHFLSAARIGYVFEIIILLPFPHRHILLIPILSYSHLFSSNSVKYVHNTAELDNMFVHLTNVAIQKQVTRGARGCRLCKLFLQYFITV